MLTICDVTALLWPILVDTGTKADKIQLYSGLSDTRAWGYVMLNFASWHEKYCRLTADNINLCYEHHILKITNKVKFKFPNSSSQLPKYKILTIWNINIYGTWPKTFFFTITPVQHHIIKCTKYTMFTIELHSNYGYQFSIWQESIRAKCQANSRIKVFVMKLRTILEELCCAYCHIVRCLFGSCSLIGQSLTKIDQAILEEGLNVWCQTYTCIRPSVPFSTKNIVAAFRGMHVSPAKHSNAWLPRKCDYRTDARTHGQTDRQTPDKVIPMCRYASQATQKWLKILENSKCTQNLWRSIVSFKKTCGCETRCPRRQHS